MFCFSQLSGEDDLLKVMMKRFDRSDLLRRTAHVGFMEMVQKIHSSSDAPKTASNGGAVIAASNAQDELGCQQGAHYSMLQIYA